MDLRGDRTDQPTPLLGGQVAVVLAAHAGWAPSPRTLQRHFAALGLNRPRPDGEGR